VSVRQLKSFRLKTLAFLSNSLLLQQPPIDRQNCFAAPLVNRPRCSSRKTAVVDQESKMWLHWLINLRPSYVVLFFLPA